jgi:hypothetical protein
VLCSNRGGGSLGGSARVTRQGLGDFQSRVKTANSSVLCTPIVAMLRRIVNLTAAIGEQCAALLRSRIEGERESILFNLLYLHFSSPENLSYFHRIQPKHVREHLTPSGLK